LFGYSKQAYYKHCSFRLRESCKESILLEMVEGIRKDKPRTGGRKLHIELSERLPPDMRIGRDALFALLDRHGYLLRRSRTKVRTTDSGHDLPKYPNIIKDITLSRANQLWVSDITYLQLGYKTYCYLSLITDAYSHKIVGYHVCKTLHATGPMEALQMALAGLPAGRAEGLIHHSDRGCQYCSLLYTEKLKSRGIRISMTENGDPRENAIAERVNGILKGEWLNRMNPGSLHQARQAVSKVVELYNTKRKHSSIAMLTPEQAHQEEGTLARQWRTYYKKTGGKEGTHV
jgi:transposase InsO family protein